MCKTPARALTVGPDARPGPGFRLSHPVHRGVHTPCIRDGRTEGAGIMVKGAGGWGKELIAAKLERACRLS